MEIIETISKDRKISKFGQSARALIFQYATFLWIIRQAGAQKTLPEKKLLSPMCKVKLQGAPVFFQNPNQSPIRGSHL
jgi:hypothetical protein